MEIDDAYNIIKEASPNSWSEYIVKNLPRDKSDDIDIAITGGEVRILIRYRDIKISNTRKQYHIIPEIFVLASINIYHGYIYLYGIRRKITYNEYLASYRHSHLRSYKHSDTTLHKLSESDKFCTGNRNNFEVFQEHNFENEDKDIVSSSFYDMIYNFLCYESLEGRPHIYMSNIKSSNLKENTKHYIKFNLKKYPKFYIYQNEFYIEDEWLNELFEKTVIIKNGVEYFPISTNDFQNVIPEPMSKDLFIFKNVNIPYEIVENTTNVEDYSSLLTISLKEKNEFKSKFRNAISKQLRSKNYFTGKI